MVEAKEEFSWPPLESDPEILTSYMHKIGMSNDWELVEVIGLEPEFLSMVPPTAIALILTYDYTSSKTEEDEEGAIPEVDYFMWQTGELDNACGLIACLHAVFNNRKKVEIRDPLNELWELVAKQTPEERAKTLDNFKKIKEAHKACSAEGQSDYIEEADQVRYHFTCFTRNDKGELVELDGMAYNPKLLNGSTEHISYS